MVMSLDFGLLASCSHTASCAIRLNCEKGSYYIHARPEKILAYEKTQESKTQAKLELTINALLTLSLGLLLP